jgi:hypothetical protein
MFASRLAGPLTAGFFVKQPKASCVEGDLEALLVRMRQRRYHPRATPSSAGNTPTLLNGDPVPVETVIDVNYTLN